MRNDRLLIVERAEAVMEFEGQRAGSVGVGDDFDIGTVVGEAGGVQGVVKLGAGGYFRGVPRRTSTGILCIKLRGSTP
jgi:hypothetical protein